MKSPRQLRAERAAERMKTDGRKPIVIEFAGTPKAGKTTTLNQLHSFLKRCGFRVETVVERASVCPIRDKKHANFNIWTASTTLAQVLEKTQSPPRPDDPDILILDRGLFDSICWLTMMERLSRITADDLETVTRFLRIADWRKRISLVIVMTSSAEDALIRERGYLPVEGGHGSIMNKEVLEQMRAVIDLASKELQRDFNIRVVDTSSSPHQNSPQSTAEHVADIALGAIERQLEEQILSMPRAEVASKFGGRNILRAADADSLSLVFRSVGDFRPRNEVEDNRDRIQALPVAIVRNKTGQVLLLKRKERDEKNLLHQKLVIWAGGHVREEDATNGNAILLCVLRELQEELRLSVEEAELRIIGAIHIDNLERTGRHVAIVFEWRAETDDVAVALSSGEFYEKRGTSLSGRFVDIEELQISVKEGRICEAWSKVIVEELLTKDSQREPRLQL